jgi:hypothetical protein
MRPEWIILIIAVLLRIIAAYWNTYISPLIGSEYDALGFHDGALKIANKTYTAYSIEQSYMYFLGFMYRITGISSQFFGSLLSCAAWFLSAVALFKIFEKLEIKKYKLTGMVFYVALPSSVIYTSLTMREPFMLLFINCMVLSFLNLYKRKEIYVSGLLIIIFSIFIIMLNISFITSIALMILSVLIIKFTKNNCLQYFIAISTLYLIIYFFINIIPIYYSNDYNIIDVINARQNHIQKFARASYENGLITDYKFSLAKFVIVSFTNYMVQPINFDKMIFKDYILFFENIVRIGMFFLALIGIVKAIYSNNVKYAFLFFTYLIIELTWASYTINWGTAVRHHLPSFGILTVLSVYALELNKKSH